MNGTPWLWEEEWRVHFNHHHRHDWRWADAPCTVRDGHFISLSFEFNTMPASNLCAETVGFRYPLRLKLSNACANLANRKDWRSVKCRHNFEIAFMSMANKHIQINADTYYLPDNKSFGEIPFIISVFFLSCFLFLSCIGNPNWRSGEIGADILN